MTTSILAMIGEWTGKVRSTPTPKLTFRTLKVSPHARTLTADHRSLEDLDPLAVSLDHADVDFHRVSGSERGDVVAQRLAIDEIGRVHRSSRSSWSAAARSRAKEAGGASVATG